ncbi:MULTISPECIES: DUF5996 family protein [unclassified Bradyrhizobium]|uniref:DUF5996 family protein n=1 Tax=unclassified Bradyrhizobium TaxID=2631580 RepID=UPI002479FBFA|nr:MULTISPECIES: DUF5996 family protein [unclassified Bradyrhizobium]WGS21859.1 DUF5996 family protein [Bradyrhizobium sp. ISRA463]WGS28813.1 DUF5996 family protein [Bradyrhizobium sp. ISRA464]
MNHAPKTRWPELPTAAWRDTAATLQLWTQIVGKIRLAKSPWLNHSWHVTLYVTARGLTTSPIPDGDRTFEIDFDFIDRALRVSTSDGAERQFALAGQSVASFYATIMARLKDLGIDVVIDEMPNELPDPVRFSQDTRHTAYDADAVRRFHQILVNCDRMFKQFRTAFLGKASPVHFFWGSFDLAVTRFSGRTAPQHPGGVPYLPDTVAHEAYSHEVSSAGFWPGGGAVDYPAFYSYAYPEPAGYRSTQVRPDAAFFNDALGEFILPYDAVRTAADPDQALLDFLQSTYEAAANSANWNRDALECAPGRPGTVRRI